jgi:hypothetical protein
MRLAQARAGERSDFSVCGGRSELATAMGGAIRPAWPNSDFLTSLIFRVFQRYPRDPDPRNVRYPVAMGRKPYATSSMYEYLR